MKQTESSRAKRSGPPLHGHLSRWWQWHPETLFCALTGHVAPAASVRRIRATDSLIALPLSGGSHVARCLRCDAWIISDPAKQVDETLSKFDELRVPKRGKELRDTIVLKVIAIDRAIHSVFFGLVFAGVLLLETHLGGLQDTARHLISNAQSTLASTGQESSQNFAVRELNHFASLKKRSLEIVLVTSGAYCVVEGLEAVGLWLERRWAEYLTVLATAGFLPLEIHEIIEKVTVLRVGALVINLLVLIYLVYAKRLFGLRGGFQQDEALRQSAENITVLPGQPETQSVQVQPD